MKYTIKPLVSGDYDSPDIEIEEDQIGDQIVTAWRVRENERWVADFSDKIDAEAYVYTIKEG